MFRVALVVGPARQGHEHVRGRGRLALAEHVRHCVEALLPAVGEGLRGEGEGTRSPEIFF